MNKKTGSLIIGYDFSNGEDNGVLTVGKRNKGQKTGIVSAFQGKEAKEIFDKLISIDKQTDMNYFYSDCKEKSENDQINNYYIYLGAFVTSNQ